MPENMKDKIAYADEYEIILLLFRYELIKDEQKCVTVMLMFF